MLTKNILLKEFGIKKNKKQIKYRLLKALNFYKNHKLIKSFSNDYSYDFSQQQIKKFKKFNSYNLVGMGGSSLGTKAIYNFLKPKVKKKFTFIDNLNSRKDHQSNEKRLNIIISKSGNTIETIANVNVHVKKNEKNLFITENKKNSLFLLAEKLKSEIIHHNNYIGGRYSVLSEVGMLPAELMGLKSEKFRQYNSLIKNKNFLSSLIKNVSSTLFFIKNKKFN